MRGQDAKLLKVEGAFKPINLIFLKSCKFNLIFFIYWTIEAIEQFKITKKSDETKKTKKRVRNYCCTGGGLWREGIPRGLLCYEYDWWSGEVRGNKRFDGFWKLATKK